MQSKGLLLFKTKGPDCEDIGLGSDLGTIGAWHLDFRDDCSLGIEHNTSRLHSGVLIRNLDVSLDKPS